VQILKVTVPAILGLIALSFCSWRIHQDAAKGMNKTDSVEIIVYSPTGVIIQPTSRR